MIEQLERPKRPLNMVKARYIALERIAETIAACLYWAENHGWQTGTEPEEDSAPQAYRPSGNKHGRIARVIKTNFKTFEGEVSVQTECDLFSGEYKIALGQLEPWERDAISAYFQRPPVPALERTPLERPNPDCWQTIGAPLFISPPNLQDHKFDLQLSAFVALVLELGMKPRLQIVPNQIDEENQIEIVADLSASMV